MKGQYLAVLPIDINLLCINMHIMREYSSSGEDVSVNAVIIPRNWGAIPSEGGRGSKNGKILST